MQRSEPPWQWEEFDTPEEVDAAFRAMRRLVARFALLFFGAVLAIPVLSIFAPWWYRKPVLGGMTANFIAVAIGIHLLYLVLGLLFERAAARIERSMLDWTGGLPVDEPPTHEAPPPHDR